MLSLLCLVLRMWDLKCIQPHRAPIAANNKKKLTKDYKMKVISLYMSTPQTHFSFLTATKKEPSRTQEASKKDEARLIKLNLTTTSLNLNLTWLWHQSNWILFINFSLNKYCWSKIMIQFWKFWKKFPRPMHMVSQDMIMPSQWMKKFPKKCERFRNGC